MTKRFSEEQIIGFLNQADAGMAVNELCRKHGSLEASYYLRRSNFGGIDRGRLFVSDPLVAGCSILLFAAFQRHVAGDNAAQ